MRTYDCRVQNKLHFSATGMTAAELIQSRANHLLPNAGKVSKQAAEGHAKAEYERFEIRRRAYKESIGEAETIKQLEEAAKELKQLEESRDPSDKDGSK